MHRRADLINWIILIMVSTGMTWYLVSFAHIVEREQEVLASNIITIDAYDPSSNKSYTNNIIEKKSMDTVILKTNFGTIELSLYRDKAPNTVDNFLKLTKSGFYDGTRFHRVIKGFMIQGGDPLSKDTTMRDQWGTGGPGYKFDDELTGQEKYPQGTLAMANAGLNTNGSQFFIMHQDYPLSPNYTIFGQVINGMDVVDKIANNPTASGDRPIKEVVVEKIEVK